jgi:hypothetical protein
MLDLGSRGHGALLKNYQRVEEYCNATKVPSKIIGVRFQLIPSYFIQVKIRDTSK